jgi:hypothetical protein
MKPNESICDPARTADQERAAQIKRLTVQLFSEWRKNMRLTPVNRMSIKEPASEPQLS